mmetsp:Transcript_24095/g.56981  ORF Transcript_24095/g.56981 Transcript_24095/m.56981 type:complete len:174 (+) Transcript_24095:1757-2278(+)
MASTKKKKKRKTVKRQERRQNIIDEDWKAKNNKQTESTNQNHKRKHEATVDVPEVTNHRQQRYPRRNAPKPTRLIDEVTKTDVQIAKERKKTRKKSLRQCVVKFARIFLQKWVKKGKQKANKSLTQKQAIPKYADKNALREIMLVIGYLKSSNKSYCSLPTNNDDRNNNTSNS